MHDNAVSFKKSDVDDLRDKLFELINDEDMVDEYKKNASDYVCKKYDWDEVVEKTIKVYEEKKDK